MSAHVGQAVGPFAGRTVAITGASSGLGAQLALECARRHASLVLFSPEADRQEQVAQRCREAGAPVAVVIGDVTVPSDCARLASEAVERFGRLDYLLANAGISMWARFDQVEDLGIYRRLVEVNYLGAVNCVHFALPHLKDSRGMIVAVSSIQGRIAVPLHTGYVASKHALQGFCETLRMELHGTGVDVLMVMPHWLRGTELRQHAYGQDGRELGQTSRRHSSESVALEDAAAAIIGAMRRRRRELIIPWKLRALLVLNLLCPRLAERLIRGAVRQQDQ